MAGSSGGSGKTEGDMLAMMAKSTRRGYEKFKSSYMEFRDGSGLLDSMDTVKLWIESIREGYRASSLLVALSHVKSYLRLERGLDLGKGGVVLDYLERRRKREVQCKAPAFTEEQVVRYLTEAPDDPSFLAKKLVMSIGCLGGLRAAELCALRWDDVAETTDGVYVTIRRSKTDQAGVGSKVLVPELPGEKTSVVRLLRRYCELVPEKERLLLQWHGGKFVRQPIGKNAVSAVTREAARLLGLKDWKDYRGHCLRATMATCLANAGGSVVELKRHGRWKSSRVAESYARDCPEGEIQIAKKIARGFGGERIKSESGGSASSSSASKPGDSREAPGEGDLASTRQCVVFQNCTFRGATIGAKMPPE
jgi:integrase